MGNQCCFLCPRKKREFHVFKPLYESLEDCLHNVTYKPDYPMGAEYLINAWMNRSFKTGDVIAFNTYDGESRTKNCGRCIARCQQGSPYTHVGIVLNVQNRLLLAEVTTRNKYTPPDVITGHNKRNGVFLFDLYERMATDPADFYHVPLKEELDASKEVQLFNAFFHFYKMDPIFDFESMFGAGFDYFDFALENDSNCFEKLFCAEMVCALYQKIRMLPQDFNCSEQRPVDTASFDFQGPAVCIKNDTDYNLRVEKRERNCCFWFLPSRKLHYHRNKFNVFPEGSLFRQSESKEFKDDANGNVWVLRPILNTMFHNPFKWRKLILPGVPFHNCSSEIIVNKAAVKKGVITKQDILYGSFNYFTSNDCNPCFPFSNHYVSDVYPNVIYCQKEKHQTDRSKKLPTSQSP